MYQCWKAHYNCLVTVYRYRIGFLGNLLNKIGSKDKADVSIPDIPDIISAELFRERTGNLIILYHGTKLKSALAILNGEPLSVETAIKNKYSSEIGVTEVGFYLTPDYGAAEMFALRVL